MSKKEVSFLKSHSLSRLATASKDDMPHVVPVVHALDENGEAVIAVDYGTKKLKNLRENPKAALLVDNGGRASKTVLIQGRCEIHERGREYLRLLKVLLDRFEFYRANPWGEGESPILVIKSEKVVSWGLSLKDLGKRSPPGPKEPCEFFLFA